MRRVVLVALAVVAGACSDKTADTTDAVAPLAPEERAVLPVPRTEVAGAALGNRIVVVGGLTGDGAASALVHFYDAAADAWTDGPALPAPIHHAAAVGARDRVWVVGGFTNKPDAAWEESAAVWSLGEDDGAWRAEAALPAPRGALGGAATDDGTIVAFGGVSGGSVVGSTVVLRPGATEWEPGPELADAREHTAATVIDGRVFAIAGRAGSLESNKRSVESWDPSAREGSWRREPPLRHTRGGIAAAGRCVAGGEEPGGTIPSVECLARDGERWEVAGDLRRPRHGLAVVELARAVHVIGGGEQPGLFVSGVHEVFGLASGVRRSRGS